MPTLSEQGDFEKQNLTKEASKPDSIDMEAYNKTIPYSEVLHNLVKKAMQITIFMLINNSFQVSNTIVIGHSDDKNQLAALGLGQLYICFTMMSIIWGF